MSFVFGVFSDDNRSGKIANNNFMDRLENLNKTLHCCVVVLHQRKHVCGVEHRKKIDRRWVGCAEKQVLQFSSPNDWQDAL